MKLDVQNIIQQFEGVAKLRNLAKQHLGVEMKDKTIQKWRERESIPSKHMLTLKELSNVANLQINFEVYIDE